jgi:cation diffusion facilitator family transporter
MRNGAARMLPKRARTVVYAALGANVAIAAIKFAAATVTGSSAMLSEGVHSLVDTVNELLLLYGMKRASKPPDLSHPLGHGRELYFWSFIVALLVFALGAGVSLYEGIAHVRHPVPLEAPFVNYLVLAASFASEVTSWSVAFREFRASQANQSYFDAFRASKDPTTFTVLFEDTAAILGLLIAAIGIAGAQVFGMPSLDGVASIGIAVMLGVASILLARETKELLIGEAAHPLVRESLLRIAGADRDVLSANGVTTVQLGPSNIVAALSAKFHDHLNTTQIEECIDRIESAVTQAHPEVTVLFVRPQTANAWQRRIARLAAEDDDGHSNT